jgi:hypothetical protein
LGFVQSSITSINDLLANLLEKANTLLRNTYARSALWRVELFQTERKALRLALAAIAACSRVMLYIEFRASHVLEFMEKEFA